MLWPKWNVLKVVKIDPDAELEAIPFLCFQKMLRKLQVDSKH